MVNIVGHRSWILSQAMMLAYAIGTAFEYAHWIHSTRSDASVESKVFLGLSVAFLFLFFVRFACKGLVTKRDYFGEEMAHRRSLAKEPR